MCQSPKTYTNRGIVSTMQNKVLNRKAEIEEQVRNDTDSITKIVNPGDITHQDIDSWENVDIDALKMELAYGMDEWTYPFDHPYASEIENLAIDLFLDQCVRIPGKHLNPDKFNGPQDAITEGYWLNSLSYQEARELVYEWNSEIEFFHEFEREAMEFVENIVLNEQLQELK